MQRRVKDSFAYTAVVFVFIVSAGCAGVSESLPVFETSLAPSGSAVHPADLTPDIIPAPATQPTDHNTPIHPNAGEPGSVESAPPPAIDAPEASPPLVVAADAPSKDAPDEFYDPFAKQEETLAAGEDYDPWEGFNSAMFEFNRKLDKYIIKPVAKAYDKVVPNALQKGISNFYYNNIHFGPRLLNNVFQLKFKGAGIELSRFLINNVIGLAGFFDPAKHWLELETPQEDTGQTLGAYGVPPGPYLVLPLLPPFTLRDFFGYLLDFGMNPVNYFLLPTFEVDDWPSAIAHKNRDTTTILQLGRAVEDIVNYRSLNLETFEGVEEATVDLYSAVRNAYLQKRAKAIRE
ncbi:MAG: VacJ family lipoprotein [Nitrospirae bacterium]|nr:VacJ family lipoprotein [Nitrospirota bacterium]